MGREIMFAVDVDADREAVFRAVSTQEGLRSFWTPDAEVPTEVGGVARFGFEKVPLDIRMRIDRLDADEVAWTCLGDFPYWADTKATWRMQANPEGPGTRVTFSHTGWPSDQPEHEYASVSYTWGQIVARLHDVVPSGRVDP